MWKSAGSLRERFENSCIPEPNSGCWLWTAYADKNGYGKINDGGISKWAHRVSHVLYKGEIPDGFEIDHRCCNPACVNPEHLDAVTPRENQMRMFARGRGIRGGMRKTHCLRGHSLSGDNLWVQKRPNGKKRICLTCKRENLRRWRRKCAQSPKTL